jgi:two-component system NtrC family sensor kinase
MDLTDIHEVLESVLKLMRKQLQQSGVGLSLSWDKGVPFIEANQTHLRQIFLNLVLNAIDAMPQGGALHISTSLTEMPDYHPAKGAAVRIHIKDTGAGMSPETLSRLFEPFFTTKEQGSGLGLSISYGIIEAHYGEISVDSREGVGTEINVLLPVKQP